MAYDKSRLQRRVYLFDNDMVERIDGFRRDQGIMSEAEAVRRLVGEALQAYDTPRSLVQRVRGLLLLGESLAVAVFEGLAQHRLVETVEIKTDLAHATLKDGTRINIAGPMDWSIEDKDGKIVEESKA